MAMAMKATRDGPRALRITGERHAQFPPLLLSLWFLGSSLSSSALRLPPPRTSAKPSGVRGRAENIASRVTLGVSGSFNSYKEQDTAPPARGAPCHPSVLRLGGRRPASLSVDYDRWALQVSLGCGDGDDLRQGGQKSPSLRRPEKQRRREDTSSDTVSVSGDKKPFEIRYPRTTTWNRRHDTTTTGRICTHT